MKDENKIEVVFLQPGKSARCVEISNDLGAMQDLVGGNIEEYMPFEDDVAIICNDGGKIRGLELNRGIYDKDGKLQEIICGDFFICYAPIDSENFLSMPEDLKKKYGDKFKYPEKFYRTKDGIKAVKIKLQEVEQER